MNSYLSDQLNAVSEARTREANAKLQESARALLVARRFILAHLPAEMWPAIGVTKGTPVEIVDHTDVRLVATFPVDDMRLTLVFTYRNALGNPAWADVHVVAAGNYGLRQINLVAPTTPDRVSVGASGEGADAGNSVVEPPAQLHPTPVTPAEIVEQNRRFVAGLIFDAKRCIVERRQQQMAHVQSAIDRFEAGASDWNTRLSELRSALLNADHGLIDNRSIVLTPAVRQTLATRITECLSAREADEKARTAAQKRLREQADAENERRIAAVFHRAAGIARDWLAREEAHKTACLAWAERETARLWRPMIAWEARFAPAFTAPVTITLQCPGSDLEDSDAHEVRDQARNALIATAVLLDDPRQPGEHTVVSINGRLGRILIGALLYAEEIRVETPADAERNSRYYRTFEAAYRGGTAYVNAHPLALRDAIAAGEPEPIPPQEPKSWYAVLQAHGFTHFNFQSMSPEDLIEWADAHPMVQPADAPAEIQAEAQPN